MRMKKRYRIPYYIAFFDHRATFGRDRRLFGRDCTSEPQQSFFQKYLYRQQLFSAGSTPIQQRYGKHRARG